MPKHPHDAPGLDRIVQLVEACLEVLVQNSHIVHLAADIDRNVAILGLELLERLAVHPGRCRHAEKAALVHGRIRNLALVDLDCPQGLKVKLQFVELGIRQEGLEELGIRVVLRELEKRLVRFVYPHFGDAGVEPGKRHAGNGTRVFKLPLIVDHGHTLRLLESVPGLHVDELSPKSRFRFAGNRNVIPIHFLDPVPGLAGNEAGGGHHVQGQSVCLDQFIHGIHHLARVSALAVFLDIALGEHVGDEGVCVIGRHAGELVEVPLLDQPPDSIVPNSLSTLQLFAFRSNGLLVERAVELRELAGVDLLLQPGLGGGGATSKVLSNAGRVALKGMQGVSEV